MSHNVYNLYMRQNLPWSTIPSSIESDPICDCETFKTHFEDPTALARNVSIICQWQCATKLKQQEGQ